MPLRLAKFLFSARGRISRHQFWLNWFLPFVGFEFLWLIIFIAVVTVSGFTDQAIILEFPMWFLLGLMITCWPFTAVLVKRIHDRNKPGWIVLAYWIPAAFDIYVPFYNLFQATNPHNSTTLLTILGLIEAAVTAWFFIEFGCMRGTIGPNQYGQDPVS